VAYTRYASLENDLTAPHLMPGQITQLAEWVAEYITVQRAQYTPSAMPLSPVQRTAMDGFFSPAALNVGLLTLRGERIQNPLFYRQLQELGFRNLPDQSTMAAVTFSDVVVSHVPVTNELLFHELVHVEQYRQVGIARFSEFYVIGFLNGGGYESIPLEVHAYTLGAQYEANPQMRFSVEDAVRDCIRQVAY
jgi:hypothetical protein